MSAASLYESLHDTIAEQVALDDPLSPIEIIGALEMCKHDLLTQFDDPELDELDDDDEDCGCAADVCAA